MNLFQFSHASAGLIGELVAALAAALVPLYLGGAIGVVLVLFPVLAGYYLNSYSRDLGNASGFALFLCVLVLLPGLVGRYVITRQNVSYGKALVIGLGVWLASVLLVQSFLVVERWLFIQIPIEIGAATYTLLHSGLVHSPIRSTFKKGKK